MADIIVADDEFEVRECVKEALEGEGHAVRLAADGVTAIAAWRERRPDLMVLDVMMPGRSGFDVVSAVRAEDLSLPILLLSARNMEQDVATGLALGADDYVTKPIRYREFLARVSAALRRGRLAASSADRTDAGTEDFQFGSHRVEVDRQRLVAADGAAEPLSRREVGILRMLAANPGAVVSREAFFGALWGQGYFGTTRTLDTFISTLRRKLGPDGALIEPVFGSGYRYGGTAEARQ